MNKTFTRPACVFAWLLSCVFLLSSVTLRAAVPKPPTGLTAVASTAQITLTWTDASSDETGFELERSEDGIKFARIAELAVNIKTYVNTGLDPATKYWYRVLARNASGKSAYSNIAIATTPQIPPKAPGNLVATSVSQTQINMVWADLSNNETGFQVERSPNGTTFVKIADIGPNMTSFQNTGLTAGTQYYYRVRAVNVAGASEYSNVSSAKTQNIPVPDAPVNFTAVPTAPELVQLRWSPVTGNATEVVIERSKGNDEHFTQIRRQPASLLQYEDKTALEPADYYYRIKAVNAGGDSPYSLIAIVRASSIITGVEPVTSDSRIYSSQRTLVVELQRATGGELFVYDLSGRIRTHAQVRESSHISLEQFAPGVYIAVVRAGKEVISKRILLY